ncbi:MAG TPA: metal ABC transporter ATP-binding protein [Methanoregulaceae archaeon]|nr:MAG: metal ABC transporter ATP-binding protein [Methanolinea sp.]HON81209.1 metal ABC transporter ATP-binding protein [Methanoregulaceae archaeon]HPD10186.1 metal ABC transporter ATP-binding protein [Methanoregulaceae archaeon]HRT15191.1 metal ABC transporter ATP-binding protein [Methanoregulaceae archaeon]HRU30692.1 metal ABC transporter ATP-binding protein [Methanoregulaceae archaeon]
MPQAAPLIELRNVYTAYEGADRPTLTDISLSIGKGEFVVIGGPNGAGKTTLLETINGMLPITHGTATVCGHDVRGDGIQVRCRVGYLLQNFAFDPLTPFTVGEVVMMGRFGIIGLFRKPGKEDREAVEEALHLLGIEDLASRPIGQLSGGQQQKVLLAQNLARHPEILLLDEPFSNLDMFAREAINSLLTRLVASGITVVIVSHAFDDLPDRPVRVVVMHDGKISLDRECLPSEVGSIIRSAGSVPLNA